MTDPYLDAPAPSVLRDLETALESTPRLPRDLVSVTLARRYARALDVCLDELDSADAIEDQAHHARKVLEVSRLGARLEATLDRLGMSPGARPAARGDQPGGDGVDPQGASLEQLRADATAGAPTSGVDTSAFVDPSVTDADTED